MLLKPFQKIVFSVFLLTFLAAPTHAAGLEARLDRSEVVEGEPVVLTLSTDGGASGTPDLAPLQQDFDLLSQGQSNSMSFVNGRTSSQREWHLTLMPRRTGKVQIPPVQLGAAKSRALTLEVLPAAAAAQRGVDLPVMLEADVESASSHFVQQQLVYTVRVLHAVPLRDANLSMPQVDDALVYPLGDGTRFETYRNGRQYQAIERRFAILPQRSGELRIGGPVLTARIPDSAQAPGQQAPGSALRDRFFGNDPFAGVFGQSRPVQSRAPDRQIDVRPPPPGSSAPWLPAESLTLNENWSPDGNGLRVGEPVTRTVVITAQGLADEQLPELDLGAGAVGVKVYPDRAQADTRPDNGTLVSQKVLTAAIVPQQAGPLELPELTLGWWDVNEDRQRIARIPARTVEVAPAAGSAAATAPRRSEPVQPGQPAQSAGPGAGATGPDPRQSVDEREAGSHDSVWRWLAILFGLAWLGAMALWWRARRGAVGRPVGAMSGPQVLQKTPRTGLDELSAAFATNDPRQARQALIDWAGGQWPGDTVHDLGAVGQRLAPEARTTVMQIDAVLFGREQAAWDGQAAWQRLRPLIPKSPGGRKGGEGSGILPPLYPDDRAATR
jgi:hypothetical protein